MDSGAVLLVELSVLVALGMSACPGRSPTPANEDEVAAIVRPTGPVPTEKLGPVGLQKSDPPAIPVECPRRTLEIVAIDAFGNPIADAFVSLGSSGATTIRAGSDGTMRVWPIYAESIDFVVGAPDFEPTPVKGLQLVGEVYPIEVWLSRTYSVRVGIVDADGNAITAAELKAVEAQGAVIGRTSRCPDEPCFLIEELPPAPFRIFARMGGTTLIRRHPDPRVPEAVLTLPHHGGLLVEFSEPITEPAHHFLVVRTSPPLAGPTLEELSVVRDVSGEPPVSSFEIPDAFVGVYTIELYERSRTKRAQHHRGRTENVVVRAGERAVVRLPVQR